VQFSCAAGPSLTLLLLLLLLCLVLLLAWWQGLVDRFRPKGGFFSFDTNFLSVYGGNKKK